MIESALYLARPADVVPVHDHRSGRSRSRCDCSRSPKCASGVASRQGRRSSHNEARACATPYPTVKVSRRRGALAHGSKVGGSRGTSTEAGDASDARAAPSNGGPDFSPGRAFCPRQGASCQKRRYRWWRDCCLFLLSAARDEGGRTRSSFGSREYRFPVPLPEFPVRLEEFPVRVRREFLSNQLDLRRNLC